MIRRKDIEHLIFPKHIPEFSPEFADAMRASALIVLSTQLQGSRDVIRPDQKIVSHGKTAVNVLGYDNFTLPHLTVLKTALSGDAQPGIQEPDWLGGYALRPFPHPSTFSQHEHLTVSGIREQQDEVREIYYGSHPNATQVDPDSGYIAPSSAYNRMSMGVLSSPLDPARRSKLRFWFSPYEVTGPEWRARLVEDPRLDRHLYFDGTLHYDGFTRHSFAVDKQGLSRAVRPGEEQLIVSNAQPVFGVTELCQAQLGKQLWHVYASGNVRAPVAVPEMGSPLKSLHAVAKTVLAAGLR